MKKRKKKRRRRKELEQEHEEIEEEEEGEEVDEMDVRCRKKGERREAGQRKKCKTSAGKLLIQEQSILSGSEFRVRIMKYCRNLIRSSRRSGISEISFSTYHCTDLVSFACFLCLLL